MMFEQNLNTVSTRAKPCFEVLLRYYVVTFLSDRTLILLLQTILFLHWMHTNLGFRLKLKSNQKKTFLHFWFMHNYNLVQKTGFVKSGMLPPQTISLCLVCAAHFWQHLKYDSVIEKHR